MEISIIIRSVIGMIIAISLAYHGKKKNSLSTDGAIAAVLVGFLSFTSSYRFGIILILFYYTSSKLTKIREDIKSRLEDSYQVGGQRNAIQVFSCSILATLVAVIHFIYCGSDRNISFHSSSDSTNILGYEINRQHLSNFLTCMYIAHYATAAGDTWASEVGILSTSRPRLVTTLFIQSVPHGTNGGMSFLGTIASAAGGAFIGCIYYFYDILFMKSITSQYPVILLGFVCGIIGSLIDSLLGATFQITYYSSSKKCIVKIIDEEKKRKNDNDIIRICGMDYLSNEAVNFYSIWITMIISLWLGPMIFQTFL